MLNKRNPQLNRHGELIHLLSIEGLPREVLQLLVSGDALAGVTEWEHREYFGTF